MERLTFVDEKGNVLFTPKGCSEDVGYTIIQVVEGGHIDLLNEIASRLANYEQRLKSYEDLEEQGLLLRLPCKVGDTVYEISRVEPYRNPAIREMGIVDILIRDNDIYITLQDLYDEYYDNSILSTEFGKTVFLTQAEAEQKLKEMAGD